jgi:hypothetical protein
LRNVSDCHCDPPRAGKQSFPGFNRIATLRLSARLGKSWAKRADKAGWLRTFSVIDARRQNPIAGTTTVPKGGNSFKFWNLAKLNEKQACQLAKFAQL